MVTTFLNPTIADFKLYFERDFPFGTNPDTSILDSDIQKAFGQTNMFINPRFFSKQENYDIGYYFLAAHWLVIDLRAASQGIAGRYNWLETSKSVDGVSSSYAIPQRVLDNPTFSMLSQTQYGAKYLQLIFPQLVGQIFIAPGHTKADGPSWPWGC